MVLDPTGLQNPLRALAQLPTRQLGEGELGRWLNGSFAAGCSTESAAVAVAAFYIPSLSLFVGGVLQAQGRGRRGMAAPVAAAAGWEIAEGQACVVLLPGGGLAGMAKLNAAGQLQPKLVIPEAS